MLLAVVIGLILVALAFDFINGFHDAANSIATVVSTRVLSPLWAVVLAGFFNFVAAAPVLWGSELKVANTMGKGVIQFEQLKSYGDTVVLTVIFAALAGAIVWNLLTWWWGLPSSSSHALAGGLIGAALPSLGTSGLVWYLPNPKGGFPSGIAVIVAFIVLSPVIGMVLGTATMVTAAWVVRRFTPAKVDRWFRRLQLVSASIFSFSHGTNDAQKVMGIIAVILYGTIWKGQTFHVPFWVVLSCHAAIGLGTAFGGWRIVRTMGHNLTKLQPIGGFCAETGGGVTILGLAALGIPVSTTHTITGAIVGVGSTKGSRAVRWGVAGRIIWAWIFTIPASAAVAAVIYYVTSGLLGAFGS
ncbi:MAG TPA: inorganic phosphate transporter [Anaeromyxobacteraceae bacterium]|nr:inorganic phosphate transporter [Anaeromyxobacteraceae bacterium]